MRAFIASAFCLADAWPTEYEIITQCAESTRILYQFDQPTGAGIIGDASSSGVPACQSVENT